MLIILKRAALIIIAFFWSINTAHADELPEPLELALQEAEANKDLKLSYTQTFRWPGTEDIVERYDANAQSWELISGNPEALSSDGRKKWRTYKRVESKPGGLLYTDYRSSMKDVTLVDETDLAFVYRFKVGQGRRDDIEEGAEANIKTRIVIDKSTGAMKLYSIEALQGFKPNAFSRLDEFVFEHEFSKFAPDLPPAMTRVYWRAKGKRGLSNIDEEYTILYSDFVTHQSD